jgi:hypothetical protein
MADKKMSPETKLILENQVIIMRALIGLLRELPFPAHLTFELSERIGMVSARIDLES